MQIVRADPFTLVSRNRTHVCELNYKGSQYLLFSHRFHQVCPLTNKPSHDSLVVFEPPTGPCDHIPNNTNSWKKENCEVGQQLPQRLVVQVKRSPPYNVIYCNGYNITFFGRNEKCPTVVFKLLSNVSFEVGTKRFESSIRRVGSTIEVAPYWVDFINTQVLPAPPGYHLDLDTERDFSDFEAGGEWYKSSHASFGYGTVLTLALIGLVLYVLYRKGYLRELLGQQPTPAPRTLANALIEMQRLQPNRRVKLNDIKAERESDDDDGGIPESQTAPSDTQAVPPESRTTPLGVRPPTRMVVTGFDKREC